jgi:ribose transport system substrate-binding protein
VKVSGGFWRAVLVVSVLLGVMLAGCGGDDDDNAGGSKDGASKADAAKAKVALTELPPSTEPPMSAEDGLAEAQRLLEEEIAPDDTVPPSEPVDASKTKGKTLLTVPVVASIPIVKTVNDAAKEALALAGANLEVCDGKGQVAEYGRCIEQGIVSKAAAMIFYSIPTSLVRAQIQKASQAGVEIIQGFEWDTGLPPLDEQEVGVGAQVTFCYSCVGRRLAHFVTADSGGKANAVIFWSSDVPSGELAVPGITQELDRLCPDCKYRVEDVPVPQWSRLATLSQSIVKEDPSIDYFIPIYDGMVFNIAPALHAAGAQDRVKVASFNATPAVMEMMKKGDIVAADVGANNVWFGWGIADQFFRLATGQEAAPDQNIPLQTFTRDNVDDLDLKANESTWYGDTDYEGLYKKAWGLAE